MSIEGLRLTELIEFAQQSARLRSKPAATVSGHGLFALYEHQTQDLPGIRLNVNVAATEDEIWLAVERLHETRPPEVTSTLLRPWIYVAQVPTEEPRLLDSTDGKSLIEGGAHLSSAAPTEQGKPSIDATTTSSWCGRTTGRLQT